MKQKCPFLCRSCQRTSQKTGIIITSWWSLEDATFRRGRLLWWWSRVLPSLLFWGCVPREIFSLYFSLVKESENHWQPPPAAVSNSEIISPRRSIVSTTSDQRESRKRQVTIMEAAEASIGPTVEDDGLLLDEVDEDLGGYMFILHLDTKGILFA